MKNMSLDALPDLSDTQVIIYTEWAGRSPDLIENQITYPLTTSLLSAPKVKAVRGFSFLGSSFIYVIFTEGTDIYWARSRILEYIQTIKQKIPSGVNPVLGPDATSLGWGFSYALVDKTGKHTLAELRSIQDYQLKLGIESVSGVAQVASVGGFVKQYNVTIDPQKLAAFQLPLTTVINAVRQSNIDIEGRVLEVAGIEYMIRGKGYIKTLSDIEDISVGSSEKGIITVKNIATVTLGPDMRRGVAELNGHGEVAGGIVIVRFGENVLNVIQRVKEKIRTDISPVLPTGVEVVVTYDRSDLIQRSIVTLQNELIKLSLAVGIVCFVFLLHLPSALVIIITLPVAIICSFIVMRFTNMTANIMSLSGIAIAIGAMVDASIIMVENTHKRLEDWTQSGQKGSRLQVMIEAMQEVGPSLFFSLLVIMIGFLPVFALEGQAGRLFKPLAFTKTFAMLFASFLAITLTPALIVWFLRGKLKSENINPMNRILSYWYEPIVKISLKFRKTIIFMAIVLMTVTLFPISQLGTEFMPPLNEGSFLFMPVTAPAISISEASRILQLQDQLLKQIPEVESVFGKVGRAETATDPAPPEMFETVITVKPEAQWRKGITTEKLLNEMNQKVSIPGVANSFTMPIKARIDMLSTGIRTPLGIKIFGPDIATIQALGQHIEAVLRTLPNTRSVYAERVNTGYFLDITLKRDVIARYGLQIQEVQELLQSILGGTTLTTTVEGREHYDVNVRYARDFRDNVSKIKSILIPIMSLSKEGSIVHIPLGILADIRTIKGPTSIKSEGGFLTAYVYITTQTSDMSGYVKQAKLALNKIHMPQGYRLQWSGEFEVIQSMHERLILIIPFTLCLIAILIYLNTKSLVKTSMVMLAVPFSLVGSFWLLYLLHYNFSVAVWIGLIAMAGLDAETGIVMLLYLDLAYQAAKRTKKSLSSADIHAAIMEGAVKRIRPKLMTVSVILAGLVPILFANGAGADVMKRIAAPMVGGIITSTILELVIYPVLFAIWKERRP